MGLVTLICQCCQKEYQKQQNLTYRSKYCSRVCQTASIGKTHGMHKTKIHRLWRSIKGRCYGKSSTGYHNYGARGIKMCDRWLTFENFFQDVGDIPFAGAEIDRIDNDGDYEPGNVRWVDHKTNSQKRRTSRFVIYLGNELCLREACKAANVKYEKVQSRRRLFNLSYQDAFDLCIKVNDNFKGREELLQKLVLEFTRQQSKILACTAEPPQPETSDPQQS